MKRLLAWMISICIAATSPLSVCAVVGSAEDSEIMTQGTYTEGEVLAIVRDHERPQISGQVELLAAAGPEAVKRAIAEWGQNNAEPSTERMQINRDLRIREEDSFAIWCVSDHSKTTAQLMQELYADPKVIAAEPNYLAFVIDEEEAEEVSETDDSAEPETDGAADAEDIEDVDDKDNEDTANAASGELERKAAENKGDLSPMQWYVGGHAVAAETSEPATTTETAAPASAEAATTKEAVAETSEPATTTEIAAPTPYTTPLSPTGGYSLEVPGWQEGRTNKDAPANAGGTICIMDTGIDTDHPDLQGVLYEFTPEQQAKYGCGKYGYNASGDGRPVNEQKAVDSHGTHVAGIIAANWNGEGVSGIANGVKIFSVNVFGGNGIEQDMKSVIKGFQFLVDVAQEVNLKAVNCSWGTAQPLFILSVMVEELGRNGVNTVIASGNRYCDLDETIDLGSQIHSEYAIVVDAASMDGQLTDFSCWGQDSTDVLAPGGSILSCVTQSIREDVMGSLYSYEDNTRFYPEVTAGAHLLSITGPFDDMITGPSNDMITGPSDDMITGPSDDMITGIERFDGEVAGVRFFDRNPALSTEAKEIGEINKANGFDDKRSAALPLSALPKEPRRPEGGFSAVNGYVYMAVPVTSGANAKWISVKTAMSDGFKPNGGIDSITCAGADGKPVEIDCLCASTLKKGWNTGAFSNIYQCQWTPLSYNVDGFIEASNELHEMLQKGMTYEERRELGILDYRDPGKVTGPYEWKNEGRTYLIARIGIGEVAPDSRSREAGKDTALYIDNAAVGDQEAYTGAYMVMSGTSMAAPAVTGCLGVIAKDEPESASMTDAEREQAARERAAKLLAAVDYDDSLSKLCRTGGRVNLHGRAEFVRRAPLITRAEVEEQMLHLEGWYFGQKGTITIDGIEIEAKDWQDQKIEASVRSVPNGSHVVTVTNEEGAVNRAVFSVSSEESEGRKLFERSHSLPINDPAFIEDHCDRLYGPMAVCGGKIYTMASTAKYKMVQGIWCYDIERDAWSRLSLPEGFDTQSVPDSAFAGRQGKLYLYGTYHYVDEDGGEASENALWRYEPYGDFWERLEIPMPVGAEGICVLRDELFVVEGNVYGMKLDGAPPDEGEDYMSGFYKVDLANRALIRVATGQEGRFFSANAKVTAGKDRIYIYAPFEDDDPPVEEDTSENAPAEAGTQKKTVSEGRFLRASYDAARNRMTFEDLTDEFNRVLGQDLRTEYEYNMGADTPGEHFAIAGLDDGVAIIGSSSPGEDVHIIYDTEKEAAACDRATSYHMAFDPIAAYADGTLYVIGYNTTEPDVMYFRSQEMTPRAPQNGIAAGEGAGKGPVNPKILGGVTIGLFALVLLVLAQMKKNTP